MWPFSLLENNKKHQKSEKHPETPIPISTTPLRRDTFSPHFLFFAYHLSSLLHVFAVEY